VGVIAGAKPGALVIRLGWTTKQYIRRTTMLAERASSRIRILRGSLAGVREIRDRIGSPGSADLQVLD
jgi:hypothetical protein